MEVEAFHEQQDSGPAAAALADGLVGAGPSVDSFGDDDGPEVDELQEGRELDARCEEMERRACGGMAEADEAEADEEAEMLTDKRSGKFQAELRLLEAVARPRVSHAREGVSLEPREEAKPWLSAEEAMREEVAKPRYLEMPKESLRKFRPPLPREYAEEMLEGQLEHADVQRLPRSVPIAESSTGFDKIKQTSKSRQLRHDEAVKRFKEAVIALSEELEGKVITEGRELRDRLAQMDADIAAVVNELQQEDHLRMQDYNYVTASWETLLALCEQRKAAVHDFDAKLEAIERARSESTSKMLSDLVGELVSISYKLRGEVERLVEKEAHEVNLVLINNLKMKSELVAKMLKKQVLVFHSTKASWQRAETRWRHLRHARALDAWRELLASPAFTQPAPRDEIIAAMVSSQQQRHTHRRLELLRELHLLVPDASAAADDTEPLLTLPSLTEERIAAISQQLAALDNEEAEACERFADDLAKHREAMMGEMLGSREALRAELHSFAALAEAGDIFTSGERGDGRMHRVRLGEGIADPALDDFFRRAGGLKQELAGIVQQLGLPELIHNAKVEPVLARVELLVEASHVAEIKTEEGKLADLKALETTLEKLRTARTAELAPLVPVLCKQTTALRTDSLGPKVLAEIDECLELLARVLPEGLLDSEGCAQDGVSVGAIGTPGLADAGATEPVDHEGDHEHQTSDHEADHEAEEEGHEEDQDAGATKPGKTRRAPVDAAEVAYKQAPLNLTDLRAAQRRLGTVVHASNLLEPIRLECAACAETLRRQLDANATIDEVIAGHCEATIAARDKSVAEVREEALALCKTQRMRLDENCRKLVAFFTALARQLAGGALAEEKTDVFFENSLDKLADSFDDDNARREGAFEQTVRELRHAPDTSSLNAYFEQALGILEDIDSGYRTYHRDGIALSKAHPERAQCEATQFHDQLAVHFGLVQLEPVRPADSENKEQEEQEEQEQERRRLENSAELEPPTDAEIAQGDEDDTADADASGDPVAALEAEAAVEDEDAATGAEDQVEGANPQEQDGDTAAEGTTETETEGSIAPLQDPEQVDKSPKAEVLEESPKVPVFEYAGRYRFELANSCEELARRLLVFCDPDSEDEDHDEHSEEDAVDTPEPPQLTEAEDGQEGGGDDSGDAGADPTEPSEAAADAPPEAGDAEEAAAAVTSAAQAEAGDAGSTISEGEDAVDAMVDVPEPLMTSIEVPVDFVTGILESVRGVVFKITCEARRQREDDIAQLCSERCEDFTEELEERLRLHWPRKGRTDVEFQQPRSGELLQHQQRYDRHVRAVNLKKRAQSQHFQRRLERGEAAVRKFRQVMNGLMLHLEAQSNVAALQGILKKGKTTIAAFQAAMSEQKEEMLPFVRRSNEILEMNANFLVSCITFENGGDYNVREVEIERRALQHVEEELVQTMLARTEELQALFTKIRETRLALAGKFQAEFDRCLQALSVREGFGRKYGAPRRGAQEKLRSEIALSENAERHINTLLSRLEVLCKTPPGSRPEGSQVSLSVHLKTSMDELRRCLYYRGVYLESFDDLEAMPKPELVELQDLPVKETERGAIESGEAGAGAEAEEGAAETASDSSAADPDATLNTGATDATIFESLGLGAEAERRFWAVVEDAHKQCRAETRELYEREGMLDELNESGKRLHPEGELLPESLVNFLTEYDLKARGYREESSRALREQVERLHELMLEAPRVALEDVAARAEASLAEKNLGTRAKLEAFHAVSKRTRDGHAHMMRPRLGDPNHQDELALLKDSEETRAVETHHKLLHAHAEMLAQTRASTSWFTAALCHTAKALVAILDTLVQRCDFRALPGDELVVTKRMGLRKLRKARLRREGGAVEDGEPDRRQRLVPKEWPGLDLGGLRAAVGAFRPICSEAADEAGADEASAADATEPAGGVEGAGEAEQPEEHLELAAPVQSHLSQQHRGAMQARADVLRRFVDFVQRAWTDEDKHYGDLLAQEAAWADHWRTSLEQLRKL